MADQQQPTVAELTDAELVELANDPRTNQQVLAKLTPGEKQRFVALRQASADTGSSLTSKLGGMIDVGEDVARGAVKGAGETAFNLGSLIHSLPGIGHATDALANLLGPEGTNAATAFDQVPADLKPTNTAQAFGKGTEQIGEFFIPAGKVGMAQRGAAELVGKMPKAAGTVRKAATDAAWKAAPVADNAVSSGAVAMAHGEEDPQYVAGTQALMQTLGIGAGQLTKILNTSAGRQLAPIIATIGAMKLAGLLGGDFATVGGTGLAANAATRNIAKRVLSPQNTGKLLWRAEGAGEKLGTLGAGAVDETRRRRREP